MTDSYKGNGDGSVTHQKVQLVHFNYTTIDILYRLYYGLITSTKLTSITDSTYLTDETSLPSGYKITGNMMELTHACDEGCRWVFKKSLQ